MDQKLIFLPACVMVFLTYSVLGGMMLKRSSSLKKNRAKMQDLCEEANAAALFQDSIHWSDNFDNLFELPVLFYLAVGVLFATQMTDEIFLGLAWTFTVFRVLHTAIHCTTNRVAHRFGVFFVSTMALFSIWVRIALKLLA